MALKQSVIATVSLLSATDIKEREVLTSKTFARRLTGSVLTKVKKVLAQNQTLEAQNVGNFFWVESEKPVQVTITGSNGGAPQVCTSNGFIVWYGALAGVLITQMDASENTVTLAWA